MEFYTLENKNGMKLKVADFGGIVSEIHVPDRDGQLADVNLGFDTVAQYAEANPPFFGALIGRFGNRIGGGTFTLEGETYQLACNDGPNHLHGGLKGYDKVEWSVEKVSGEDYTGLKLDYVSKDGEEGYPGTLKVTVIYKLTDANEWVLEYEATTDKTTVFNPTNHAYFNLAGHDGALPLDHLLEIKANFFTPTDANGIPTGEIRPVEGTPLDFRVAKTIGQDVDAEDFDVSSRGGFDHNFVVDKLPDALGLAAVAYDPKSGREMKVYTTEPGVQFYSGNFIDGTVVGKGGYAYPKRSGFCLETQHFPDAPNKGHFPSVTLRPGEIFHSKTVYAFSTR